MIVTYALVTLRLFKFYYREFSLREKDVLADIFDTLRRIEGKRRSVACTDCEAMGDRALGAELLMRAPGRRDAARISRHFLVSEY